MYRFPLIATVITLCTANGMLPVRSWPRAITAQGEEPSSCLFEAIMSPPVMESILKDSFLSTFNKDLIVSLLTRMAAREQIYTKRYVTFYHGTTRKYLLYLTLNKLLHKNTDTDFAFLRAPGTRTDFGEISLHDYATHLKVSDHNPLVRQHLLPVSYTPLATKSAESALFFFLFDQATIGYCNEKHYLTELCTAHGLQVLPHTLTYCDTFSWPDQTGIMLQICIRRDIVDQLAYDAAPCGAWTHGPLVDLRMLPLSHARKSEYTSQVLSPFLFHTAIECTASSLKTVPLETLRAMKFWSMINGQARILLRPGFFDHPNELVKIFEYDLASDADHASVERTAENIIAHTEHR